MSDVDVQNNPEIEENDPYADDVIARAEQSSSVPITPFGVVVFLAAILMIAVVAWGIYDSKKEQPREGPAPDFELSGDSLMLPPDETFALPASSDDTLALSDLEGRVIVLNFWGSWCVPCRVEAPMLQRTYEAYKDQGVLFIGIIVKDTKSNAQDYIDEFGITYPNVLDKGGKLEDAYNTTGVPETFVIGKDGEITQFFYAQPRESELRQVIEDALDA